MVQTPVAKARHHAGGGAGFQRNDWAAAAAGATGLGSAWNRARRRRGWLAEPRAGRARCASCGQRQGLNWTQSAIALRQPQATGAPAEGNAIFRRPRRAGRDFKRFKRSRRRCSRWALGSRNGRRQRPGQGGTASPVALAHRAGTVGRHELGRGEEPALQHRAASGRRWAVASTTLTSSGGASAIYWIMLHKPSGAN